MLVCQDCLVETNVLIDLRHRKVCPLCYRRGYSKDNRTNEQAIEESKPVTIDDLKRAWQK